MWPLPPCPPRPSDLFRVPVCVCAEDDNGTNGYGGAIFAAYGSKTEFNRRTIWHNNEAASGGALYNLGEVWLYSNGFIRGNKAVVNKVQQFHQSFREDRCPFDLQVHFRIECT